MSPPFHVWLLRHGNTFGPSSRVVWLGREDDPPLVPAGISQIHGVAACFQRVGVTPALAFCAPYARTRQCIRILEQHLGVSFPHWDDERLCELDYGGWNGLTNDEIELRDGAQTLRAWLLNGQFPAGLLWQPSAEQLKQDAAALLNGVLARGRDAAGPALIVSTNSRLRSFLSVVGGAAEALAERGELFIRTGHLAHFSHDGLRWHVNGWNLDPASIAPASTARGTAGRDAAGGGSA